MTVSDAELWEVRARAADDAAEQVSLLAEDLGRVLGTYYLGDGCVEGEELHAALLSYFGQVEEVLVGSVTDARHLAAQCREAARALSDADRMNAAEVSDGAPG